MYSGVFSLLFFKRMTFTALY